MSPIRHGVLRYYEAFAGIGGATVAAKGLPMTCVGGAEYEPNARAVYWANHGKHLDGNLWDIDPGDVEPMDMFFMSPPCTPYSRAGNRRGLNDPAGKVIFAVLPLIERHKPSAIIVENTIGFNSHADGRTIRKISKAFERLGYHPLHECWRALNSAKFGLPTRRVRFFGVMLRKDFDPSKLIWPNPSNPMVPLRTVLLPPSQVRDLVFNRTDFTPHVPKVRRGGYHLQRLGHFDRQFHDRYLYGTDAPAATFCRHSSGLGGSSGLYLVGDVIRKLHPREMLRAHNFSDDFVIPMPYAIATGLIGNSLCPPVLNAVYRMILPVISNGEIAV